MKRMSRLNEKMVFVFALLFLTVMLSGMAIAAGVAITKQPEDITAGYGERATFSVEATGENDLTYKWFYRDPDDKDWNVWPGEDRPQLHIVTTSAMRGRRIRCAVTGNGKTAYSNDAVLRLRAQVESFGAAYGYTGEQKTIYVSVTGPEDLQYQWYYRKPRTPYWIKMDGMTEKSFSIVLTDEMNQTVYNCIITDQGEEINAAEELGKSCTLTVTHRDLENDYPVTDEKDIWFLSSYYATYLTMPDNSPSEVDMSGHELKIISGDSAEVKEGKIVPKLSWNSYTVGDTKILVDGTACILVHVRDYATEYAEGVINQYLKNNITSSMTDYEKAVECCKFIVKYPYGSGTSYTSLVVAGKGDCWASTDTLLYMFETLGIEAESHSAANMPGAGSGHVNVMAKLDGIYYTVEAGVSDPQLPRRYFINGSSNGFQYSTWLDHVTINAFLNMEHLSEVTVPAYIQGVPVTEIGQGAMQSLKGVKRIILPESVTEIKSYAFANNRDLTEIEMPGVVSIGESAFERCTGLQALTLPANLTTLEKGAMASCTSLLEVKVAQGNTVFQSIDGVLFTREEQKLVYYPTGRRGSYTVPSGTTAIGMDAFFGATVDALYLPQSLSHLEADAFRSLTANLVQFDAACELTELTAGAFFRSYIPSVILPASLKIIGDSAFGNSRIISLTLPNGITTIGQDAFHSADNLRYINLPGNVTTVGDGAFLIGSFANMQTCTCEVDADCQAEFGSNVFGQVMLMLSSESTPYQYAVQNNVPYQMTSGGTIPLQEDWFNSFEETYEYQGEPVKPKVTTPYLVLRGRLAENADYKVSYVNNDGEGTGKAIIQGIGLYSGQIERPFKIVIKFHYVSCYSEGKLAAMTRVVPETAYSLPLISREGYILLGLFTEEEGGEIRKTGDICHEYKDETLFAHWKVGDLNKDGAVDEIDLLIDALGRRPESVIKLPSSLTKLEAEAFQGVTAEVFIIPKGISEISSTAFNQDALLALCSDELIPLVDQKWSYLVLNTEK